MTNLSDLIGKTLASCAQGTHDGNDAVIFETIDGDRYILAHQQDCCESVWLEDIDGLFEDMVGSPITMSECVDGVAPTSDESDEYTDWSFYRFQTAKGFLWLRWCGQSEYYSTGVSFWKE